jgi:hypothetical protein
MNCDGSANPCLSSSIKQSRLVRENARSRGGDAGFLALSASLSLKWLHNSHLHRLAMVTQQTPVKGNFDAATQSHETCITSVYMEGNGMQSTYTWPSTTIYAVRHIVELMSIQPDSR